ncbi:MAG: B12-binding domain-containing radical SAM protein [Candidatus Omnitrophica bacterium]|nr:B12-binding domain-containing radical SAM protein [Candidatus Omnitrophota bacterium]
MDKKRVDILFVQNYYERYIGIMSISAVLKKYNFITDVIIGEVDYILKKIIETNPKVIGFHCTTGFHHRNINIAAAIKKIYGNKVITIFGGPHPTFVPSMIKEKGVDIICRGEGEFAVLELMQALRDGLEYNKIKNLSVKMNGRIYENELRSLCNVNDLPHPDREIYKNIKYTYKNKKQEILVSRGCPFNCSFCSAHAFRNLYKKNGNYVRVRSIPNVIDELERIKNNYKPSCFLFYDETFNLQYDYCFEFLNEYRKKINIPFGCLIKADLVTESFVKLLKESGCHNAQFGIESGNEKIRNMLFKKDISEEKILKCGQLLHKYKIPFITFNMVGAPGETLSQVWDTVNLNIKVKPAWARFSSCQPLPGTELAEYSLEHGYLSDIDIKLSDATYLERSIILNKHVQGKKIIRLKNIANLVIKIPILKSFAKIMLYIPLDLVYRIMDKLFFYICYQTKNTYKMSFYEVVYMAFFYLRRRKEFDF